MTFGARKMGLGINQSGRFVVSALSALILNPYRAALYVRQEAAVFNLFLIVC